MIQMNPRKKWFAAIALCFGLSGIPACKSVQNSEDDSELAAAASSAEASKFTTVTAVKFTQLQADPRAEFLGCLCVADQGTWAALKFLKVASKGYKSEVSAVLHNDVESCVTAREQATQQCGG